MLLHYYEIFFIFVLWQYINKFYMDKFINETKELTLFYKHTFLQFLMYKY